jgi:hypothetical protein
VYFTFIMFFTVSCYIPGPTMCVFHFLFLSVFSW